MDLGKTFESIILKNILEDKSYFNRAKTILKSSIFSDYSNAKIYDLIYDYYEKYRTVPNMQEIIVQVKDIPNNETRKQIAESLIKIKDVENVKKEFLDDETVKYVKDQMFTQALMLGAEFIDKKDDSYKIKAKELIDNAQLVSINADLGNEFSNIEERIEYYQNPKKGLKFKTLPTVNEYIGEGYLNGTLNIVMAPAGTGKSLFLSVAIGDFLLQKKNILLVSMEMTNFEFLKRIDANLLNIQISSLKDVDADVIRNNFNKLDVGRLFVQNYPAGSFSANNLSALLEMYKTNNIHIDAVFLDYLGIMKSDRVSPSAGLYSYIKAIGEEVRAVATIYDLPIFSCSQLNRGAVNNTNANNEAISDSLGTAMTADWICFLLQNEQMKQSNIIKFKITKNRYNGKTSTFDMNVNYQNMRFEDTGINKNELSTKDITEIIDEQNKNNFEAKINEWNFNQGV